HFFRTWGNRGMSFLFLFCFEQRFVFARRRFDIWHDCQLGRHCDRQIKISTDYRKPKGCLNGCEATAGLRSNLDPIRPRRTSDGGSRHFRLDPLRSPCSRRRCLRFRSPPSRRRAPPRRPPRHRRPGRRCHSRSGRTSRPAPPEPKTITSDPVPQPRPPWTRSPAARARRGTTPPPVPCHASALTRSPLARCASLQGGALLVLRVAATKEHQGAAE